MRIDSVEMLSFSPTGGTKKVVELLSRPLGAIGDGIDLTRMDAAPCRPFEAGELAVIGIPSYGGRVPAIAAERIAQLQGNGAMVVLVCTYGNRAYDDTLCELRQLTEASGFIVIGMVAAVTEHSLMPQYGTGRPNRDDRRELGEYSRKLREKLERSPNPTAAQLPPKQPNTTPLRSYGGVPLKPVADKRCLGCAQCVGECPVGAINRNHPNETDYTRCISCMRCVKRCPRQARHCGWLMQFFATQALRSACKTPKSNELHL